MDTKNERCPHCGYCPHCGRSNQPVTIVPPQPYYPWPIYPQPWGRPYPYVQYTSQLVSSTDTVTVKN